MSAESARWYPSKVDRWLVPVLCLPPAAAVAVCLASAIDGSTRGLLVGLALAALIAGLYLGLVFPVRYGLDDAQLVVRFGLCRQRVPLAGITEVRPTSTPLSAPALSLDRLRIRFGRSALQSVVISPADIDRFLDDLARTAGLARQGDRLVRE